MLYFVSHFYIHIVNSIFALRNFYDVIFCFKFLDSYNNSVAYIFLLFLTIIFSDIITSLIQYFMSF